MRAVQFVPTERSEKVELLERDLDGSRSSVKMKVSLDGGEWKPFASVIFCRVRIGGYVEGAGSWGLMMVRRGKVVFGEGGSQMCEGTRGPVGCAALCNGGGESGED